MRKRVSINTDQMALEDIWEYYQSVRDSLVRAAEHVKLSMIKNPTEIDPKFFAMNAEEVEDYFEKMLDEADKQASLFLIASAEAALRVDFYDRVYERKKDDVSQEFRRIYKSRPNHKIVLDDDILATWAGKVPQSKAHIGDMRGALHFRHWLAHGRYWVPKFGRRYDPAGILQVITHLFSEIGLSVD